ncbi:hypothetical protein FOS14_00400 [Skermania sp. ID1734]|uniref:acyl-CoA thioester hydrolase/BAAT C-terminal domain-containing protein n=1 Tax=Skermania sp. ID1734 TaxID=2597516 RepID=UPI00117F0D11|nr:acyl-CoA thioester hydrolase/BAAT C-terminal domain-containing protein [Skermania sp. ID1734]TSE01895.1 hypothetical protein FOS14_00400 [Skermania sp. ID1734]
MSDGTFAKVVGVDIVVDPADCPVDSCPSFRTSGLPADARVELRVSTVDAAGHEWRSTGAYTVEQDGTVQLPDPDRPWWDMEFTDRSAVPVTFSAPDDGLEYQVELSALGETATATATRRWSANVVRDNVRGDGWMLRTYLKTGLTEPAAGVVVVPGSTGLAAMAPMAALLAARGYAAAVLAYMGEPGLPESFREIPLEAIDSGMRAFAAWSGLDRNRVGVVAASVGTGAVLSALALSDAMPVRCVVAISPTDVVWQALGSAGPPPKASSLTHAGAPLPYLPIRGEKLLGQIVRNALLGKVSRKPRSSALTMLDAFARGAVDSPQSARARIPVERIDAPILAVAGSADKMWPAKLMAAAVIDRRRQHGTGEHDELLVLDDVGHFVRPPVIPTTVDRNDALVSGGTPVGVARGQRRAWATIVDFLESNLR